jgi:multisubunit Na+/H+ antiporter MnhF subunit
MTAIIEANLSVVWCVGLLAVFGTIAVSRFARRG